MKLIDNLKFDASGNLQLDQCNLKQLTEQYGSPLFAGSRARIEQNINRFYKAFKEYPAEVILSYSTKTNSNVGVLQVIRETPATAGVCSGLDFAAAKLAGFKSDRIIFDGLVKHEDDLRLAIRESIRLINVESWDELLMVDRLSKEENKITSVGMRVRIGPSWTHRLSVKSLLGIAYDRFGFDLRSGYAESIIEKMKDLKNVRLCGLMVHEGSHYMTAKPYLENFQMLLPLIKKIETLYPGQFEYLNLGGGFGVATVKPYHLKDLIRNTILRLTGQGVSYALEHQSFNLEEVARQIIQEVKSTFEQHKIRMPALVFEPGRYVVGDAFVLIAKVLLKKDVPGSGKWLVVNAGTNLFPYLLSFNEYHQIVPLKKTQKASEVVNIAGPLLYSSDILMKNCVLPELAPGDSIAILDAGAYTLAYSNQFLYPRPAVLMIDPKQGAQVIREAETKQIVMQQDRGYLPKG